MFLFGDKTKQMVKFFIDIPIFWCYNSIQKAKALWDFPVVPFLI